MSQRGWSGVLSVQKVLPGSGREGRLRLMGKYCIGHRLCCTTRTGQYLMDWYYIKKWLHEFKIISGHWESLGKSFRNFQISPPYHNSQGEAKKVTPFLTPKPSSPDGLSRTRLVSLRYISLTRATIVITLAAFESSSPECFHLCLTHKVLWEGKRRVPSGDWFRKAP